MPQNIKNRIVSEAGVVTALAAATKTRAEFRAKLEPLEIYMDLAGSQRAIQQRIESAPTSEIPGLQKLAAVFQGPSGEQLRKAAEREAHEAALPVTKSVAALLAAAADAVPVVASVVTEAEGAFFGEFCMPRESSIVSRQLRLYADKLATMQAALAEIEHPTLASGGNQRAPTAAYLGFALDWFES